MAHSRCDEIKSMGGVKHEEKAFVAKGDCGKANKGKRKNLPSVDAKNKEEV